MTRTSRVRVVRTSSRPRRAALLLEVIVALAILVAAMGLLGAQLVAGLQLTSAAAEETRATQLADRMIALLELDPQTTQAFFADEQSDGDFGDSNPGWFWQAQVVRMEDFPGMGQFTIEILHQDDAEKIDSAEGARVVRSLHMLKADPGRINLAEDFGVDEEVLAQLAEQIPIPGLDPTALDPQALVGMDPLQLLALLPQILPLIQQFAGSSGASIPPEIAALLRGMGIDLPSGGAGGDGGAGGFGGGGGRAASPQEAMIRQLISSQLGDKISQEQLDAMMANLGNAGGGGRGGRGGGGGGRPDDGGEGDGGGQPPPPNSGNGLSRDFLRSFISSQLGDQVSPEQLEEMLNSMPDQGGNQGAPAGGRQGGAQPLGPGTSAGGGTRGGSGGGANTGGRQPTNIRDINNNRGNRGGGNRGGGKSGGGGRGG